MSFSTIGPLPSFEAGDLNSPSAFASSSFFHLTATLMPCWAAIWSRTWLGARPQGFVDRRHRRCAFTRAWNTFGVARRAQVSEQVLDLLVHVILLLNEESAGAHLHFAGTAVFFPKFRANGFFDDSSELVFVERLVLPRHVADAVESADEVAISVLKIRNREPVMGPGVNEAGIV